MGTNPRESAAPFQRNQGAIDKVTSDRQRKEEQQTSSFMAEAQKNLPEMHEIGKKHLESKKNISEDQVDPADIVRQTMMGPGGNQQPHIQQQQQPTVHIDEKVYQMNSSRVRRRQNSLLGDLRKEFGVDEIKPVDVKIGSYIITIRKADGDSHSFALSAADIGSVGDKSFNFVYEFALAVSSVCAINGEPVYKILNVGTSIGEHVHNPLFPPSPIRRECAGQLFDEFIGYADEFQKKLIQLYKHEFDYTMIETSLDKNRNNMLRYTCPTEGCSYELHDVPTSDKEGAETPYYCKYHGCPLEKQEGENSPLA